MDRWTDGLHFFFAQGLTNHLFSFFVWVCTLMGDYLYWLTRQQRYSLNSNVQEPTPLPSLYRSACSSCHLSRTWEHKTTESQLPSRSWFIYKLLQDENISSLPPWWREREDFEQETEHRLKQCERVKETEHPRSDRQLVLRWAFSGV